ncbi:hypothetical protein So717_01950 [Roseobacter cerasinus]|uniref:Uncharacterized protein n=1 Tax=Roseobacter cerasinus TaxID=2602289 RepID=A0A640VL64_9RHOB|nr:DUF2937 family protein [Roseobacter cerasinus]GFE48442.1 hypothetical protein So717_01950 [Roseobacter cerasinus]
MILRAITLAAGLTGAFGAAQFPAFSQQYLQRLGGAVDALEEVVADFDASAAAEGLSRAEALRQMQGAEFIERRRADMQRTFERHAALTADLEVLSGQGPFMRAYHAARLTDVDVARRAWQVFEPALPLTLSAAIFATVGFVLGTLICRGLLAALRWPLRRRALSA